MSVIFEYNKKIIHESINSEFITLLTKEKVMVSDITITTDEHSSINVLYDGSTILDTELGECVYTINCYDKLMSGNLDIKVKIDNTVGYTNVDVYTSSQTITLPNKSKILVVLIGGGTGGQAGFDGSTGHQPTVTSTQTGTTPSYGLSYGSWSTAGAANTLTVQGNKMYKSVYADSYGRITGSNRYTSSSDSVLVATCISAGYTFELLSSTANEYRLQAQIIGKREVSVVQTGTTPVYTYSASYSSLTNGGSGGSGGIGGSGGKILQQEINITPLSSATLVIGSGGIGGFFNGSNGNVGNASTITINGTTYTSANGTSSNEGFTDEMNNVTYALSGNSGIAGASGGSYEGSTSAYAGSDIETYTGGSIGSSSSYGGPGSGGGAAYGSNGGSGGTATSSKTGNGGTGADASSPSNATIYGNGGSGGNGGGGGGNAGGKSSSSSYITVGSAGSGGSGSNGSNGASGIILIYY